MSKQLIEYCKRYKYEHQHEHEHEGRFLFIFLKKKFTYKKFQTLLGKEESNLQTTKSINQKFQEPKRSHYSFETIQNTQGPKKKKTIHSTLPSQLLQLKENNIYLYIFLLLFRNNYNIQLILKLEPFFPDSCNLSLFSLKPQTLMGRCQFNYMALDIYIYIYIYHLINIKLPLKKCLS